MFWINPSSENGNSALSLSLFVCVCDSNPLTVSVLAVDGGHTFLGME